MIQGFLDGRLRGRQFREESPRRKDASKDQVGLGWEAKTANEDRARSPRLWVVVPPNEQAADKRGRDQTGAGDRASVVQHSALVAVSPSDADSVAKNKKSVDHMTRQKGACLKPDLNSKCEFGVFTRAGLKRTCTFRALNPI